MERQRGDSILDFLALMPPCVLFVAVASIALLALWFALGIPLGPAPPISV